MSNILLSICIPTYNRAERVKKILRQITSFKCDKIEIVISDNDSNDNTSEIVNSFNDPRIRYFRNKTNLGMDANFLLVIKRAKGKFIFLLMDEDEINIDILPWILKKIKNNKKLSQICGSIGDKRPEYNGDFDEGLKVTRKHPRKFEEILMQRYLFNKNYSRDEIRFKFPEKYFKKGKESLKELLFFYPHGSGIILRKDLLNLEKAKKYIGIAFMHQTLIAQALVKGDTLSTSKILAFFGREQYESRQDLFKGKQWWHPLSKLNQTKFRIQIIYELTKKIKNHSLLRKFLLTKQYNTVYRLLLLLSFSKNTWNFAILSDDFEIKMIFYNIIPLILSLKNTLMGFSIVLKMKDPHKILLYLVKKVIYSILNK